MGVKVKALSWWIAPLLSVVSLAAPGSDLRLADAVKNKNTEAVRSLLKQHSDVNAPEGDGTTALVWAAHWNDLETADLLIRAGANMNAANDYGVTALWEACNNASAAMVEKLLTAGANPKAVERGGETALMRCARTGSADAVKSLLAHGAEVNAKDAGRGQTALMWALAEQHPEAVRALIEHGADVRAKSKGGFTPLMFAARQGDVVSARMLLEGGADVNEATPGGLSVLLVATDSSREAFAIFLVEHGANPNATDSDGLTPLHYSLRKGWTNLRGGQHDEQYGEVSLAYMFRPNMSGLVKVLLEHGANPNARIAKGGGRRTPLRASDRPKLGLPGATPFLLAAASGDVGIMRALLAKGADPKLGTNDGVTPLMAAAGVGMAEDRTKEEEKGALEAVKLMVELGADVNAVSTDCGWTALHGAAYTGANSIIPFLVEKGARLDLKDKFGQTPFSIADGDPNYLSDDFERRSHPSTAELIRKLGGDPLAQSSTLTTSVNANH